MNQTAVSIVWLVELWFVPADAELCKPWATHFLAKLYIPECDSFSARFLALELSHASTKLRSHGA
jgi:hypothetical protein